MIDVAIEQVSRGVHSKKEANWIEKLLSSYRGDRNFFNGSRSYREAVEIVIKEAEDLNR